MTETEKGNPDPSEIEAAIREELKMTGMVSDNEEIIKLLMRILTQNRILFRWRKRKMAVLQKHLLCCQIRILKQYLPM